jgi:hypothetical protein
MARQACDALHCTMHFPGLVGIFSLTGAMGVGYSV